MIEGKLTNKEALAVQVLSQDQNWQKFKDYLKRQEAALCLSCRTVREDHRFFQGRSLELSELVRIEEKAKNILEGT